MFLVLVFEMINMLIIKLYCSVIADFSGASRKDKAVAGVMCMFLRRTSLDLVKPVLWDQGAD